MKRFKAGPSGPVLIDTHIWVWYLTGDAKRIRAELRAFLDAQAEQGALHVSDISCWEVAVKAAKGTLTFTIDPSIWLNRAAHAPGIRMLPVDRDVLLMSTRLEAPVHGDPADRMLLATALLHDLPLVTADRTMIDYAAGNPAVTVIEA